MAGADRPATLDTPDGPPTVKLDAPVGRWPLVVVVIAALVVLLLVAL